MFDRIIAKLRGPKPADVAQRELEHAEAARLKDERITDRAYARFGPRGALPDERNEDES